MITDKLHGQVALEIVKKYFSEHNVKNTNEALEFIFNNYFDEWWKKSNKFIVSQAITPDKCLYYRACFLNFLEIPQKKYRWESHKVPLTIISKSLLYIDALDSKTLDAIKNELFKEHILCRFFEETLEELINKHFKKKY